MVNDVYATVAKCISCARNASQYKHNQPLQLFPSSVPLEFVVIGIVPITTRRNQYALAMTDKYSKLPRAVPTGKTRTTQVAGEHLLRSLNHAIQRTKLRTNRWWSVIRKQLLRHHLRITSDQASLNDHISSANRWAGRAIQQKNCYTTEILQYLQPTELGHLGQPLTFVYNT